MDVLFGHGGLAQSAGEKEVDVDNYLTRLAIKFII